jgi:HSP20 family protein
MGGLIKWDNPFLKEFPLVRDLHNILSKDFFGELSFDALRYISTTVPLINTSETNSEYVLEVLAPKLKKEDLIIEVDGDILHLIPKEAEKTGYSKDDLPDDYRDDFPVEEDKLRKEYNLNYIERIFKLPDNVDTKKISATAENGIITIVIPKKEQKTSVKQQIAIK